MKCKNWSAENKRKLLEAAGARFFEVEFIKADGSLRKMNCKRWIEAAYTYGSKNARPSSFEGKPEYFLAVDMQKKEFRAINLNRLVSCKVNGIAYEFEREGNHALVGK